MGRPHRVKYLAKVLDYIMSHDGVWQATDEIAEYYLANYYDQVVAHAARVNVLGEPPGVVVRRLRFGSVISRPRVEILQYAARRTSQG